MSSLNGIISLQEAMNAYIKSVPPLNRQQFELGIIEESDGQRFYQPILYGGQKL